VSILERIHPNKYTSTFAPIIVRFHLRCHIVAGTHIPCHVIQTFFRELKIADRKVMAVKL
jgi:hypothetical protein